LNGSDGVGHYGAMQRTIRFVGAATIAVGLALVVSSPARAQGLVAPKVTRAANPEYPSGGHGDVEVVLELVVDPTGHVADAKVVASGGAAFDAAALGAARDLVFEPATRDGVPIAAQIPFAFRFVEPPPPPAHEPAPAPAPAAPRAPEPPAPPDSAIEVAVEGEQPPREATRHAIDGADARTMPGTNGDPLRAVEALPGVARPPGLSGLLIVRGSSPEDSEVFVNGAWVPFAYHFGGVTSIVPGDLLKSIDLYPGNFGPEYGRAVGGVVDMELRSPRKDRFGAMAQVDLLDGRAVVEGPLSARTRVLVAARRSWLDAWLGPLLRKNGTGVVTAPVYQDAQVMLEHDLTDRTTLRLTALGSDDRLALLLPSSSGGDLSATGDLSTVTSFVRVQLRSDTRLAGDGRWSNMIAWGPVWVRANAGAARVYEDFSVLEGRSDLRLKVVDSAHAVVGLDVREISASVTTELPPTPAAGEATDAPTFGRPLRQLAASGSFWWPGAYAMLDVAPIGAVHVLPGVRVDYGQDTRRWTIDPRLSARVTVAPDTTLKAGVGVYHEPPQPQQSIPPYGTPGLRSPWAAQTSAGVEQRIGSAVELSAEGFYNDLRDLVIAHASENATASGTAYGNDGSGRAYGLELLAKARVGRFRGWLSYTLSRSERSDGPGQPAHLFAYDETHVLSALGSYDLGLGWSVGARFRYVTGLPETPYVGGLVDLDAGSYAPVSGAQYAARLAPYDALDLRLEKEWDFRSWKLAAYVEVRNVYDAPNPEGTAYRYDYARSQPAAGLPILPIVGVRGEL
jgi:TonB family protein